MQKDSEGVPAPDPAMGAMLGYGKSVALGRRSFLRSALLGAAGMVVGAQMSGCSPSPTRLTGPGAAQASAAPAPTESKVLLAYFSRAGENYYYGGRTNLTVGNTEVLANMIAQRIGCDVHRIVPVDPYPDDYAETRERNVREQNANARPAIADPLDSIGSYDTVLLGSPIWNVRAPMIMTTFVEQFDFAGKTVFPLVTYAVSGLGSTARDYAASCPGATIGEGLAVRGEEVGDAGAAVESWLRRTGLLTT
jgi:flavodoxin